VPPEDMEGKGCDQSRRMGSRASLNDLPSVAAASTAEFGLLLSEDVQTDTGGRSSGVTLPPAQFSQGAQVAGGSPQVRAACPAVSCFVAGTPDTASNASSMTQKSAQGTITETGTPSFSNTAE